MPTKEQPEIRTANEKIGSDDKENESAEQDETHVPAPTLKCKLERFELQLFGDESPSYFTVADGDQRYTYKFEKPWNQNSNIRLEKIAHSGAVFAVYENHQDNHYVYQFIECKRGFGKVITLDNGYLPIKFEKADNGNRLLAYDWWTSESGARAIAPEVALIWKRNRFSLDKKAMRERAPSDAEINEQLKQLKALRMTNRPSVELDSLLVDLIYSGEEKRAKKVLEQCWPKNAAGRRRHWNEIKTRVRESPYL